MGCFLSAPVYEHDEHGRATNPPRMVTQPSTLVKVIEKRRRRQVEKTEALSLAGKKFGDDSVKQQILI
nr:hypothetical protein B0A51_13961 [Rachicladosporium sp. CCFEE 5018]